MNLTVAIYVEERKRAGQPVPEYAVRPLFARHPVRRDELLSRALSKLAGELRGMLDALGRDLRHDALARWAFLPDLSEHRLALRLELRRTAPTCKALFVAFDWLGRRLAFTPVLPDLWFELEKGESLETRAAEVLGAHFRRLEKEAEGADVLPAELTDPPRAWVTTVDLDVQTKQQPPKPPSRFLMLGGDGDEMSGRAELEKVGRCLDGLYPDELDRVVLRDAEVEELTRLLADPDKRPVLLVGPRQAGKTAVIHEHVFRKVDRRRQQHARKQNVWLLAPQRLISGMCYVGQWEQRLLAILDEARKREHVLYFDDLVGLFQAGLTRDADLSVAHVLRPCIERREVRVLGETTPEALRVLRERDRALADLFHILPIREPAESPNLRILVEAVRQLEGRFRCTFALDVLPTVVELLRRYARDAAMPGKAAGLLRRLATKHAGNAITRDTVLSEFNAQCGLAVAFLDNRRRLQRGDLVESIGREVIGQRPAVDAMADAVLVAKARLNDAGRPLASFPFLGPTGVGKTQAAKALAACLYGDAGRLVRFDMNEYVDATSPARLIGTFAQPEGLLTSAVRRQPFCVLLLDEIEKAHPAVFDLLLQVLGEGRLTDALGRTADFTNAIIVLTSNLGVRDAAGAAFGLRPGVVDRGAAFVDAAERFFRPEFFNRLDRVIPFHPLSREEIAAIALKLIRNVFDRDGLRQRKCVLRVDGPAIERVAEQGFHPDLGARALKRAIERQLTRPVALALASIPPATPTVITLYARGDGFLVHTEALIGANVQPSTDAAPARPPLDLGDPEWTLEQVYEATHRIEAAAAALAESGNGRALTQGQIGPAHYRYFAVRELAERIRRTIQRIFDRLDAPKRPARVGAAHATPRSPAWVRSLRCTSTDHALWREFAAAEDVNQYLDSLFESAAHFQSGLQDDARRVVREVALLEAMATRDEAAGRALIHIRPVSGHRDETPRALRDLYREAFQGWNGAACAPPDGRASEGPLLLVLDMPGALTLARVEEGTHLFVSTTGEIEPVQVRVLPVAFGADPLVAAAADRAAQDRRQAELGAGRAAPEDDPWRIGPVLRVYDARSGVLDLRSGMIAKGGTPAADDLRTFILLQLAPPAEVLA
jgi:ATP-dependent Clp protease ATP-binding subunit ClpA